MGSHGVHGGSLPWGSVVVYVGFWGVGGISGVLGDLLGLLWGSLMVSASPMGCGGVSASQSLSIKPCRPICSAKTQIQSWPIPVFCQPTIYM